MVEVGLEGGLHTEASEVVFYGRDISCPRAAKKGHRDALMTEPQRGIRCRSTQVTIDAGRSVRVALNRAPGAHHGVSDYVADDGNPPECHPVVRLR